MNVIAEREALLASGFSSEEASRILIERAAHSEGRRANLGTGVATGPLNNLDAVGNHIRSLVPSFKSDLVRMFDVRSPLAARVGAAIGLSLKSALVGVISYFVYLEYVQMQAAADRAKAEACLAMQRKIIETSPMRDLDNGETSRKTREACGL